jgi:hypothetical protein
VKSTLRRRNFPEHAADIAGRDLSSSARGMGSAPIAADAKSIIEAWRHDDNQRLMAMAVPHGAY